MDNPAIRYMEYGPSLALRPSVECYWTGTRDPAYPDSQDIRRVLPDGCTDIVIEFDGGTGESPASPRSTDRAVVVGTMSRPLIVNAAPTTCFLGVRFKPGKATGFLGVSAGELTDQSIPLSEFWNHNANKFEAKLTDEPAISAKLALLDALLLDRLKLKEDEDPYVEALVELILRRQGAVSIQALSEFAGISRQHVARKFERYIGISPKLFCRIVRFQDLIKKIRIADDVDWATTALDLGYYDQAHMISEFKEFSGQTPVSFVTTG